MAIDLKRDFKSLEQRAYEAIKGMILSGELQPNIRLTEDKMAKSLGISRTTVKKAFIRLKEEYLLEDASSHGVQVKLTSMKECLEAYEVREVLEGLAGRIAARSADEKSVSKMIEEFEKLKASGKDMDMNEFERLNYNFHKMLADCYENKSITKFIISLLMQSKSFHHERQIKSFYADGSVNEHLAVLYAIRNREEAKAEHLARKHVQNVREAFINILKEDYDRETG
ncbi:MAG: GntR family transcriptional regulator [Deltaproteobacteria bacterium]|nr:GntR family transcriptional regulator [Deltaproteobacteria bacterium]